MNYTHLSSVLLLASAAFTSTADDNAQYSLETLHVMSLNELLNLEVISASRTKEKIIDAPANITVVTAQTIHQRGYQNLIDVLRDVPGYDFANIEDSAGEYTTHSVNRGLGGSPGNVQLLILVDGVVQNHIGFNWSQPWGNQQIFADLKKIEIIQGPGSASYGANAYSGVIHFITAANNDEVTDQFSTLFDQNNLRTSSFVVDTQLSELYLQASGRLSETDGDLGVARYDPAGYFSAQPWPLTQTQDYANEQYLINSANPNARQLQSAGFNNQSKDWALRGKATWQPLNKNLGITRINLAFNKWSQQQGLGSYVAGFEYQTRAKSYQKHHEAAHAALDVDYQINNNTQLTSKLWYRENKQLPQTGFQYSYRFVDLVKSYHSTNSQIGFEQQVQFDQIDSNWLLGYRVQQSEKMDQVVSLGQYQSGQDASTHSSWDSAASGLGLNQYANSGTREVDERAAYIQYQANYQDWFDYTLGLRYDHSDEYGSTINPRLALIYNADRLVENIDWRIKFLYGQAFREPSIFELTDEFRGNNHLKPESINTYEIVSHWVSNNDVYDASLKAAVFYSQQKDVITLQAQDSESGSMFINGKSDDTYGFSLDSHWNISSQINAYANYQFTEGENNASTLSLQHTAKHKINWGVSLDSFEQKLNINFRMNHLLSRATPPSNRYFVGQAPSVSLANLVVSWHGWSTSSVTITPQLLINNLFDKQFLGVGRQDGSSDINRYDPEYNINPNGFAPPYHPQPGRTIAANIKVTF